MSFTKLVLVCLMSAEFLSAATHFCTNGYCEFVEGDPTTIIIVNAPHGGKLKPAEILDRQNGCLVDGKCVYSHDCVETTTECKVLVWKDVYTEELSRMLVEQIESATGVRPHLIVNHLHRSKMDGNRKVNEATLSVPAAVLAYNEYQGFIEQAKNMTGRGLFVDAHGFTNAPRRTMLGYTVSSYRLNKDVLPADTKSSLDHLLTQHAVVSLDDVLRGENSLGELFHNLLGDMVVPSQTTKSPGTQHYYSGGYNTKQHGSRNEGQIDSVQVEIHRDYRNSQEAPNYAAKLAQAIAQFMNIYY